MLRYITMGSIDAIEDHRMLPKILRSVLVTGILLGAELQMRFPYREPANEGNS